MNKLHDTIYENAKLRAQLFDKVSEQKDTTRGTSANTKFAKQSILGKPPSSSRPKLYVVTPLPKSTAFPKVGETNALSNQVTSNSVPSSQETNVVKNDNVLSPGIFRMNPFKASRVDNFVPNKHVKASVRTKPITVSQPHVITKNDVNSKTNGFSPKDVKSTTRTRRPLPRNNPKNDKVPSKSKSSRLSNNLEKIEENHRNSQSSSNQKHMSSECNNIKLAIWNAKSEIVCAMCKQCLITVNHDVCVLNYVNGMNSRGKKQKANVSNIANQTKHKAQVWKPKNVGSKERLALPKPSTPRSCLRWSPTGRIFDLKGKIIATSESVCQSDCSKVVANLLLTIVLLPPKSVSDTQSVTNLSQHALRFQFEATNNEAEYEALIAGLRIAETSKWDLHRKRDRHDQILRESKSTGQYLQGERISKKKTKNEAKTTKPDTKWKSM
ncbi:gag-pol polyprotein, partial [Tanacetum coccineum]